MKAVNLIPQDLRGAASGAPSRTGAGVYVVLGALGVLVVMATFWAVLERSSANKRADIAQVRSEADSLEARAGALEPYAKFAQLRDKRVQTVSSLSRNRFNWPYAIRELSRVTPANVTFTQLRGTVAPGVAVPNVTVGATGPLRSALAVPAVEIEGCSTSQSAVAKYMTDLRRIDGVTRVSLASSEKIKQATGAATGASMPSGGGDSADCRVGDLKRPKFGIVVFFERSTATPSVSAAGAPAPAPASTNDASKGTQK